MAANGPFASYASKYADRELSVFPLAPRTKDKPRVKWREAATSDAATIRGWVKDYPNDNIGMPTGAINGCFVLDLDGEDAEGWLAAKIDMHGPLPDTPIAKTASGRHILFAIPEGREIRNSAGKLAPHVDIRGEGGYIVVAPSIHPSGARYTWEKRLSEYPFAQPPQWLIDALFPVEPVAAPEPGLIPVEPVAIPAVIDVPPEDMTPAVPAPRVPAPADPKPVNQKYIDRAVTEELRKVETAGEGGRNHALNEAAFALGQFVGGGYLESGWVRHKLLQAATSSGLVGSDGIATVAKTIDSGMNAGIAKPRTVPEARVRKTLAPRSAQPIPAPALTRAEPMENIAGDDWRVKYLLFKDASNMEIKPKSYSNCKVYLRHDPVIGGLFRLDEFTGKTMVTRHPFWEADHGEVWTMRPIMDEDATHVAAYLERHGMNMKPGEVHTCIKAEAALMSFHPLREYLDALVWDGTPRLDKWLTYYLGVNALEVATVFGPRWWIGMVARIYRPGCKFDTMLVLEGPQGIGKSQALARIGTLNGKSYYTDELHDLNSKDAAMQLQGRVLVEIAELNALERAEINAIKSWLTRTTDIYRPPYGREVVEAPRSCALAGTMNPNGFGYLNDVSGGRRFWPVYCSAIDLPALDRDCDQLWAEAVLRFSRGEPWFLSADIDLHTAQVEQEKRHDSDIWEANVAEWLSGQSEVQAQDYLLHIGVLQRDMKQADSRRVSKIFVKLGWVSKRVRQRGVLRAVFVRGKENGDEAF